MNTGDEEVTVSDNIFNIYADDYSVDTEWSEEGTFLETLAPGKKTSVKYMQKWMRMKSIK